MGPRTRLPPATAPRLLYAIPIPQPYSFNPLRSHDSLRRQLVVHFRDVHPVPQPRLARNQLRHAFRVGRLVLKVRLQQQPLRNVGHECVERQVEPPRVHLGHDLERPQVPPNLVRNLILLNLDRDLPPIPQPRPMHLRHTRARPGLPLHDPGVRVPLKTHPKHLLGRAAPKVLHDHFPHLRPVVLRRVVEHAAEHLLELGRQDRALHGDCLADLEVEAAVVAQQVEESLRVARVDLSDIGREPRVLAEVDLVVERDDEAEREGAQAACQGRGVQGPVERVAARREQGEVDKAARPFSCPFVGFGWRRGAEGGRCGRCEGAEEGCLVQCSACGCRCGCGLGREGEEAGCLVGFWCQRLAEAPSA